MVERPRKLRLLALGLAFVCTAGVLVFLSNKQDKGNPAKGSVVLEPISIPGVAQGHQKGLRVELRQALGLEPADSDRYRLDLLQSLGGAELSDEECQALLHSLLEPQEATATVAWHSEYVHEICLVLTRQKNAIGDFSRALATLARDSRRPEVIRDYALQHLRQVWERADQSLRPAIESTFEAIAQKDPVIGPSALLSLHVLGSPMNTAPAASAGRVGPPPPSSTAAKKFQIPDAKLDPLIRRILTAAPVSDNTVGRMTALRIVRERSLTAFSPDLRRIASDTMHEHAVVRMAAIAAIAESSDKSSRTFLQSLDREDPRIDSAVRHALAQVP